MSRGCERIIGQRTPTKWCDEESARCSGQVGWLCPALPQHARCRPQHIQSSTPPHLPVDAEGLPSRSGGAVAECCRSSIKSACSRLTSACDRYRDKAVALVTGGSAGIGLGIAKCFAAEGSHVFIAGRRESELDKAVTAIDGNAAVVHGDISNLSGLDR